MKINEYQVVVPVLLILLQKEGIPSARIYCDRLATEIHIDSVIHLEGCQIPVQIVLK